MPKVKVNINGLWHNKQTYNAGAILDADETLADLAEKKVMVDGVVMVEWYSDEAPKEEESKVAEETTVKNAPVESEEPTEEEAETTEEETETAEEVPEIKAKDAPIVKRRGRRKKE